MEQTPCYNMGNALNRHRTKQDIQIENNVGKVDHIPCHQGNVMKTTVRYHRTAIRMATVQNTHNIKCW